MKNARANTYRAYARRYAGRVVGTWVGQIWVEGVCAGTEGRFLVLSPVTFGDVQLARALIAPPDALGVER